MAFFLSISSSSHACHFCGKDRENIGLNPELLQLSMHLIRTLSYAHKKVDKPEWDR